MPKVVIPYKAVSDIERLVDWATVTSVTQRNIVIEFTSSKGLRRFFEAIDPGGEDMWQRAQSWYLVAKWAAAVGRLRLIVHVPLAEAAAVAEALRLRQE